MQWLSMAEAKRPGCLATWTHLGQPWRAILTPELPSGSISPPVQSCIHLCLSQGPWGRCGGAAGWHSVQGKEDACLHVGDAGHGLGTKAWHWALVPTRVGWWEAQSDKRWCQSRSWSNKHRRQYKPGFPFISGNLGHCANNLFSFWSGERLNPVFYTCNSSVIMRWFLNKYLKKKK